MLTESEALEASEKGLLAKLSPRPSQAYVDALEGILSEVQAMLGVLPTDLYTQYAFGLEEKCLKLHAIREAEETKI